MAGLQSYVSNNFTYIFRDANYSNFEFNYFLTGTDSGGEANDFINISRIRVPKLKAG